MMTRLTCSGYTIVAGLAIIHDTLVIKMGIGKGFRDMANRTILSRGDVGRIGFGIHTGCIDTIVAGSTIIHDTLMVEQRRCESAASHMTNQTILGGYYMRRIRLRILAGCFYTIVAGIATRCQNLLA